MPVAGSGLSPLCPQQNVPTRAQWGPAGEAFSCPKHQVRSGGGQRHAALPMSAASPLAPEGGKKSWWQPKLTLDSGT